MARLVEKVLLYYREGTKHDKVYNLKLTEEDGGFRVTGYNGRRGARFTPQSKTPQMVSYRTALHIFDALLYAKLNHRVTPYVIAKHETGDAASSAYTTTQVETRAILQLERDAPFDDGTHVANRLDAPEF